MKSVKNVILAIASLAWAGLACRAAVGATDPQVLLSDDFLSRRWGTSTDADSSVKYDNDTLRMTVYTPDYFIWSIPNTQTYQNVHVEVKVMNNESDADARFGIMCYQQEGKDSFYYFAIDPAGRYAIVRAADGQSDVVLTGNGEWTASPQIPANATVYHLGADCGAGTLTLYVDGQKIDSVTESSYVSGTVGLFAWSGEAENSLDIAFDDFLMMQLP